MRTRTLAGIGLAVVLTAGMVWAQAGGREREAIRPRSPFIMAGDYYINLNQINYVVQHPDGGVIVHFPGGEVLLSAEDGHQVRSAIAFRDMSR